MAPIRMGDDSDIAIRGIQEVRKGDGTILWPGLDWPTFRTRRAIDSPDYNNEPGVVRMPGRTVIRVDRVAGGHVNNDGRLVAYKSTDLGQNWDNGTVISEDGQYDERNQSLVYDPDEQRLQVIYRRYDADAGSQIDERIVETTDKGESWTNPEPFTAFNSTDPTPFGDSTKTSNGIMTMAYSDGGLEAIFLADDGETFGDNVIVADSSDADLSYSEPTPLAMPSDKSRVLILGRENGQVGTTSYYIKSTDGGQTWQSPTTFDGNWGGTPIEQAVVDDSTIMVAIGARDYNANEGQFLRLNTFDESELWDDPTVVDSVPDAIPYLSKTFSSIGGGSATAKDFGYPRILRGGNTEESQVYWYDTGDGTETNTDTFQSTIHDTSPPAIVDNFEDQDLSEYGGDTGSFSFSGTTVYDGSNALNANFGNGTTAGIASTSGLNNYPQQGDTFCINYYDGGAHRGTQDFLFHFASQSAGRVPDGYEVRCEFADGNIGIQKRDGGATSLVSRSGVDWPVDEWITIIIKWETDGSMGAAVYDESGTLFAYAPAQDTTFSSGGVGFFISDDTTTDPVDAYIDYCRITDQR